MYQSHTNSAFDFDTKSKAREIISNSIMHVNVISKQENYIAVLTRYFFLNDFNFQSL